MRNATRLIKNKNPVLQTIQFKEAIAHVLRKPSDRLHLPQKRSNLIMNAMLNHGIENRQCTCTHAQHFQGMSQSATVERLIEVLRDADALLKISHSVLGTIRENLEGGHDPKSVVKMVELTYNVQRILDGYEDKITKAWLGD